MPTVRAQTNPCLAAVSGRIALNREDFPLIGAHHKDQGGCVAGPHTPRGPQGFTFHSAKETAHWSGAVCHPVSNLCPISGPHCLKRAMDQGFFFINTVIIL